LKAEERVGGIEAGGGRVRTEPPDFEVVGTGNGVDGDDGGVCRDVEAGVEWVEVGVGVVGDAALWVDVAGEVVGFADLDVVAWFAEGRLDAVADIDVLVYDAWGVECEVRVGEEVECAGSGVPDIEGLGDGAAKGVVGLGVGFEADVQPGKDAFEGDGLAGVVAKECAVCGVSKVEPGVVAEVVGEFAALKVQWVLVFEDRCVGGGECDGSLAGFVFGAYQGADVVAIFGDDRVPWAI
jgi:hypothetical protein